jgi:hypothetical protein
MQTSRADDRDCTALTMPAVSGNSATVRPSCCTTRHVGFVDARLLGAQRLRGIDARRSEGGHFTGHKRRKGEHRRDHGVGGRIG